MEHKKFEAAIVWLELSAAIAENNAPLYAERGMPIEAECCMKNAAGYREAISALKQLQGE